jgi:predicted esterase
VSRGALWRSVALTHVCGVCARSVRALADGLAYHIARSRVRFILPGGPEISSEYNKLDDDRPLRPPRQWFKWTEKDDAKSIASKVESAAAALRACAKDALAAAPGAQLVLGGFSQGAAVALHAALPSASLPTPAALVQLAAQAPFGPLPPNGLAGIKLLVAAGSSDPIAPIATANVLMDACVSAGAEARPLHTFDGEHEVTLETVHKVGELLSSLMDEAVAIN